MFRKGYGLFCDAYGGFENLSADCASAMQGIHTGFAWSMREEQACEYNLISGVKGIKAQQTWILVVALNVGLLFCATAIIEW